MSLLTKKLLHNKQCEDNVLLFRPGVTNVVSGGHMVAPHGQPKVPVGHVLKTKLVNNRVRKLVLLLCF